MAGFLSFEDYLGSRRRCFGSHEIDGQKYGANLVDFYDNSRNEAQSKNSRRKKELVMKFKSEGGLLTGCRVELLPISRGMGCGK